MNNEQRKNKVLIAVRRNDKITISGKQTLKVKGEHC